MSSAAYSILKRDRIMPRDEQPQGHLQTSPRAERTALFLLHGSQMEQESSQFVPTFRERRQTFARRDAALVACSMFQASGPDVL
jgi:hypothetical protein